MVTRESTPVSKDLVNWVEGDHAVVLNHDDNAVASLQRLIVIRDGRVAADVVKTVPAITRVAQMSVLRFTLCDVIEYTDGVDVTNPEVRAVALNYAGV